METLASGTTLIDVEHLGRQGAVASCLLQGNGEMALVDPGPTSALGTLRRKLGEQGIEIAGLTAILLTHIHLDHAGATGTLVRENPRLRVYVHERGAPHMVQPSRLLDSAKRLYGDQMDRLWGEFLAVPEANVAALQGGEKVQIAGRPIEVQYTPGHASHHVTYFDQSTGVAFAGDTAGLRYPGASIVSPLTPPPDINLELWSASLETIASRKPRQLFLTHFGAFDGAAEHIEDLRKRLRDWAQWSEGLLQKGKSDHERAALFAQEATKELGCYLPPEELERYKSGAGVEESWHGLARYWRKRNGQPVK
jgi:glyoxylase-like metal-dependent hydrolase (beta-lactamase superfamily II)